MKIKTISLSWFRGAADMVSLEPDCKSEVSSVMVQLSGTLIDLL